jgi:hypothetical protein
MSYRIRGKKVLQAAERELQRLLAEAATNAEYDALPLLTRWAARIGALLNDADGGDDQSQPPKKSRRKTSKRRKPPSKSSGYPRFVREADNLVKIGWSKREGSEYEHKAPKEVVHAVVSSVARLGGSGRRFTMDEILPIEDLSGTEIPDYQSYLVLAWLRIAELVDGHGRRGYTISKDFELIDKVDDCWNRLANRTENSALHSLEGHHGSA